MLRVRDTGRADPTAACRMLWQRHAHTAVHMSGVQLDASALPLEPCTFVTRDLALWLQRVVVCAALDLHVGVRT